ncbi:MAG: magnesium transporter MgtE N-terminal domain-containing protein [Mycobacteriales bacterium]
MASRVFITRLRGIAIIDPQGDQIGRLHDVIASTGSGRTPPRALGLLVDLQHRRRIFLPMGRMTAVRSDAIVLASGAVNMRQFEQRAGERLVLGELLDRRVTVVESGVSATVVDLAMEQSRTREWEITRAAIRIGGAGRLARRGHLQQVDWDEITGLAGTETDQGTESILAVLSDMRPADVAHALHDMPPKRRGEVAVALDDERLADVLEEMPADDQVQVLGRLGDERAADVLEAMDPDDAADLLAVLPEPDKDRLLEAMEPDEAGPVRRLLTYADDVAGGLMTTEPVILPPDATIAEALARVRNPDLSPALASQVYVCRAPTETPTGRFLGAAHIQRLLREPPSTLVSGVVDDQVQPLRPDTPLAEVTRTLATYNLVAAAVVDEANRLVGAVTVDDILDALLPHDWREEGRHG